MSRFGVVLLICACATAQNPIPVPPDLARSAYEIYAAVFDARFPGFCDKLEPNEFVAVEREVLSVPDNDIPRDMHPSSDEERGMIRSLIELGKKKYVWGPDAKFGSRSHVLGPKEFPIVERCIDRRWRRKPLDGPCSAYPGLHFIRSYSLPSFNADHTRALIYSVRGCGPFQCGGHEFQEYRKVGGKWVRQDGFASRTCAIY